MDDDQARDLLEELETRPDAKTRTRVCCEGCGSKDHLKKIRIRAKKKGDQPIELFLCPNCRTEESKRKGGKNHEHHLSTFRA